MNKKVIIAVVLILVLVGGVVYSQMSRNTKAPEKETTDLSPTPLDEIPTEAEGKVETNVIALKGSAGEKGTLTFNNTAGVTFKSYTVDGYTDRVVVFANDSELLQLGVNWLGYTGGNLDLVKVVSVKNKYIGDLYRATGGGLADGMYVLAKNVKTTGKCTNNGDDVNAPCTAKDQISDTPNNKAFALLTVCLNLDQPALCDSVMSGLQVVSQ